jgi:hypothetical protein
MITVAEHTYEETLLPDKANVMDAGCRGFLFTDELRRTGHDVYAIDIEFLFPRQNFICAIAGYTGKCSVQKSKDPQATRMIAGFDIPCYTIKDFSQMVAVPFWDLIKMDIEGSEYEVIMSLTEPPAKQLSIEFHLHTKIYGDAQVKEMEDKLLSLGYFPVKHDKYPAHGLPPNYWDSLWILQT